MRAEDARVVWSIGSPDGLAPQLVDNFAAPVAPEPVVWQVPRNGPAPAEQRWPIFHPSQADPDAGYRHHPYAIVFWLDQVPQACRLEVGFVALSSRIGHLLMSVNGTSGRIYLRPDAAPVDRVELAAGLQTAIYSEGRAAAWIPGQLLRAGENRIELVCDDEGDTIQIARAEAVKRLDRMASAAGFGYRWLTLVVPDARHDGLLAHADLHPTVVYDRGHAGRLVERCQLDLELRGGIPATGLLLALSWDGGHEVQQLDLPETGFGHLRLPVELPDGEGPVEWRLTTDIGDERIEASGTTRRRPKWVVHVAPHLHTDIGYTHRQSEVAERLCRAVDAAVEIARRYPDSFAFHLDSAWTIDQYLATRDEPQLGRLAAVLQSGHFGVSGTWVDLLTQFAALEDLIRNRELADRALRRLGAASDFVTVVDVPSITASLPGILEESGIRYLAHADNQGRGPFRLNGGLHVRSPYLWRGIGGGSVLTWLSKAYCELRKVCGSPPTLASGEGGLELWLSELETGPAGVATETGERLALLYGQEADNTDVDPQPAGFVAAWNTAHAYPRLVPGTPGAFFRAVEGSGAGELPSYAGDGGAYWEDGVGSSMAETIAVRGAQASLPAAERLEALAAIHGQDRTFRQADFDAGWRDVLQYDEHTWGAFLSVIDPDARLATEQWAVKRQFAEQAQRWGRWLLHGAASRHTLSWNSDGREVVIYNPHSWAASGTVEVEIDPAEVPLDARSGEPLPMRGLRRTTTQAIVELWIDELEGLSYRRLPLVRVPVPLPGEAAAGAQQAIPHPPTIEPAAGRELVLEDENYRLVLDAERGYATSWLDRSLGRELVDGSDEWGLGQLVYASGGEETRLVHNVAGAPAATPLLSGEFRLRDAVLERFEHGVSATLRGETALGEAEITWTLYRQAQEAELRFRLAKQEQRAAEALYVCLPLDLPGASVASDSQLGWVRWDEERLPGACSEWLPLQSTIWVSGEADVLVASPDVPLFCVGDTVRGSWSSDMPLTGGRLFSYVLNNYWHTNYRASQGGELDFRYRLASAARFDPAEAFRFGWRARRPLYAQRTSLQDFRAVRPPYEDAEGGTLARVTPEEVALTTLKPSLVAEGWLVRLQEVGGADRVARVEIPGRPIRQAWATDLVEHERAELPVEPDGALRVAVPAWGLATARILIDSAG